MLAVDVSNFNAVTPAWLAQRKAQGDELVIVRAGMPWEHAGLAGITRQQCQMVRDAGCDLGAYVWAYPKFADPLATAREAVALVAPWAPRFIAVDCEDVDGWAYWDAARNIAWLHQCVGELDALDVQPVIYTGRWWWADHWMANTAEFADLPLWAATDSKVADTRIWRPFGGWSRLAIAQFDLSGPDRDVLDDAFLGGGVKVAIPSVDERLSYLGGLTHDVLPQCVDELQELFAHLPVGDDKDRLARVIATLQEHSG